MGGLLPEALRRKYRVNADIGEPAAAGPVVIAPADSPPEVLKHETRHAEQFRVPGYPLMKIIEMMFPYGRGPLEADAFRHEQPSHELLRGQEGSGNPFDYGRGYSQAAQSYIRALLGE